MKSSLWIYIPIGMLCFYYAVVLFLEWQARKIRHKKEDYDFSLSEELEEDITADFKYETVSDEVIPSDKVNDASMKVIKVHKKQGT